MSGPVEAAIRATVRRGETLNSNSGRATFVIEELGSEGVVLGIGDRAKWSAVTSWASVEGIPALLEGRGWVKVGSKHGADVDPDSLDAYLKLSTSRSSGSYLPVVLERAGVVELDRRRPASVRLRDDWRIA